MKPGDKVALLYASANRDPLRFDQPDRLLQDREDAAHLSFGWRIHRCVGAPLAQMELRLLVHEPLAHGRIVLTGEPEFKPLEGGHHMGLRSLPLAFEAV